MNLLRNWIGVVSWSNSSRNHSTLIVPLLDFADLCTIAIRVANLGPDRSQMPADSTNQCQFEADQLSFKLKVTLAADKAAVDQVVQGIMGVVRQVQCIDGTEDAIE